MATARGVDRLRALRQSAQLLHRPGRRSPVDLVRHLVAVQAQVLPSAGQALRARTKGVTADQVDRARLEERSVVWTWALRGTLHLVRAEDLGWLVPLTVEPSIATAHRRLVQEGVSGEDHERAVGLIRHALERGEPLTRAQIAERLERRRIRTRGQAIAHLVWLAAVLGVACHGPDADGEPTFVLLEDWVGEVRGLDREAALREVAVRYLASHAPAGPEDLAAWSGLRGGDARRAWASIADRIVEAVPGGWALRTSRSREARPGLVRLLPGFDPYLLGWRSRDHVLPRAHEKKVFPGGGWFHPVVVAGGLAVGTWRSERAAEGLRVRVTPFGRPAGPIMGALEAEARDLGRYAGARGILEVRTAATRRRQGPRRAVGGRPGARRRPEGPPERSV